MTKRIPKRASQGEAKPEDQPFILTALLPPELQAQANALRQAHFPPERNFLDAHVTMFHALPRFCESELTSLLGQVARECAPLRGRLEGLMSLGGGTALKLHSPDLLDLRAHIADHFHGLLTAQDQHTPRLHVTVQNKVSSAKAKALQAELEAVISPRAIHFPGLALHIYRGGPWEFVRDWKFRG
ncbi:2'-5' RNA ligase family protein [Sphingomonadaceae bacterium]|nr:2'-5' RNA ligase family protein [Sphingomonadaceae bacterium]